MMQIQHSWNQLVQILDSAEQRKLSEQEIGLVKTIWEDIQIRHQLDPGPEGHQALLSKLQSSGQFPPPVVLGRIEWFLYRNKYSDRWGGAFNGQQYRRNIFSELASVSDFHAAVETGTFRGDTTAFLAEVAKVSVFTTETNARAYEYARLRLQDDEKIFLTLQDSRRFIEDLSRNPFFPKQRVCFYLDAHRWGTIPLRDEVVVILENWAESVIMIDDFCVPDDPGYGYDDYGNGQFLSLEYLALDDVYPVSIYWPTVPSSQETGARRGCVVLVTLDALDKKVAKMATLRRNET